MAVLPTVWSNCLAGWVLGGGGDSRTHLPFLLAGATLLHLGGSLLNDAFDADHDRLHHPDRLIPTGTISAEAVWRWALGLLAVGALTLLWIDQTTGALALALVSLLVLRNAFHRALPISPALDGLVRLLFYVIGASAAIRGVTGWSIWCGLTLAVYVAGAGCLAHGKAAPAAASCWPALLLAVPILLALFMDAGPYRETGLLLSLVVALWLLRALRRIFWTKPSDTELPNPAFRLKTRSLQSPSTGAPAPLPAEPSLRKTDVVGQAANPDVKQAISGLVAGIVFVDWLAVCPATLMGEDSGPAREVSLVFLGLFGFTLLLQRLTSARKG